MIITIPDIIGMIGVTLVLSAYALLNLSKLSPQSLVYQLMNLTGAVLLLISLCFNFNLASVVIEIVWITFSLVGIVRVFRARQARTVVQTVGANDVEFSAETTR